MRNAEQVSRWTSELLGINPRELLVMSTGVIGVQLPMQQMLAAIPIAVSVLQTNGWDRAAKAILTTDTQPKLASIEYDGITITGIAKGAGIILASGASEVEIGQSQLERFTGCLAAVCISLAQAIVRDAEGATKFITLQVTGARNTADARQIGNAIATSPLVKTAFYGGDANWGRILAATGRAGVPLEQNKLSLWYDDLQLVKNGTPLDYDDEEANAIAAHDEVNVRLALGLGKAEHTIWTCDLSHDYVDINGHYRT